jgi:Beta-lactamase
MAHTQYRNDHTSLIANRVLAYEPTESGNYRLSVSYAEENGDGMIQTSVEDLQKWDENFYSGRVGGRELLHKMEEPGTLANGTSMEYAKGLYVGEYRGRRTIWHTGESGGYRACLLRFPDLHFSVACLCNNGKRGERGPTKRAYAVAEAYLASVMTARELPDDAAPEPLTTWAGTYRDARRGEVWRIAVVDGRLQAEYGDSVVKLRRLGATNFDSPIIFFFA